MDNNTTTTNNPPVTRSSSPLRTSLVNFLAGGLGGITLVLSSYPLDLRKVLLQTDPSSNHTLRSIMRNGGGFKALYRGALPVLLGVTPILSMSIWGYHLGQILVYNSNTTSNNNSSNWVDPGVDALTYPQIVLAGIISGAITTPIVTPLEGVKVQIQTSSRSVNTVISTMYQQGGLTRFFRGIAPTFLRDTSSVGAQFLVYEAIKRNMNAYLSTKSSNKFLNGTLTTLTAGPISGVFCWAVCFPFDTLKSRIQSDTGARTPSMLETYRKLHIQHGWQGLYKGLQPALTRAVISSGGFFMGMEGGKVLFDRILPVF